MEEKHKKSAAGFGSACFFSGLFQLFHVLQALLADVFALEGAYIAGTAAKDAGTAGFVFAKDDPIILGKNFQSGFFRNIQGPAQLNGDDDTS